MKMIVTNNKEYEISLYVNNNYVAYSYLTIEDKGSADDDGYYEYYKISFDNYSNHYSNSNNEEYEIENIIKQYLRGKFSATRFNF